MNDYLQQACKTLLSFQNIHRADATQIGGVFPLLSLLEINDYFHKPSGSYMYLGHAKNGNQML